MINSQALRFLGVNMSFVLWFADGSKPIIRDFLVKGDAYRFLSQMANIYRMSAVSVSEFKITCYANDRRLKYVH